MRCVAHVMGERGPVSFTQHVRSTRSPNAFAQHVCSLHLRSFPVSLHLFTPQHVYFAHYRFTPLAPPVSSPTRAPSTFRYPLPTPFIRRAAASPPLLRCALLPRIHLHPSLPPLHCFHLSSTCYPRVTRSFGYALIGLAHTPHPRFTCLNPYSAPFPIPLLFIGRTPSSFSLQSSAWRSPNSPT